MDNVQKAELNILIELIKLFEKHNLHYTANGGTCLGAIRHNGFIPWDDDIDVSLPREEYELFRSELYKQLPDYLSLMDGESAEHYSWMFLKIHDTRTTYISDYASGKPDIYTGAFVDIMPIDGYPNNRLLAKLHVFKLRLLMKKNEIIKEDFKRIDSPKRLIKESFRLILKHLHSYDYYFKEFNNTVAKYPLEKVEKAFYAYYVYTNTPIEKMVFPKTCFFESKEMPFETISIKVPFDYNLYLQTFFGDYMSLPSPENRISGHSVLYSNMNQSLFDYSEDTTK